MFLFFVFIYSSQAFSSSFPIDGGGYERSRCIELIGQKKIYKSHSRL